MKIVTVFGGPRIKGNTATVLSWVEEELANLGAEVERINLYSVEIKPCLACAKCREKPDEYGCVQKDDAAEVYDKIAEADGLIMAGPLYFWGFSAQLKLFIDRGYAMVANYHKPNWTSLAKGKKMALVMSAADGYEDNCEYVVGSFDRIVDFFMAENVGQLMAVNSTSPDQLPDEYRTQAKDLARAMVD